MAASNLMSSLPAMDDRRLGLFGYAATCYRQIPFPGFSTLIHDHWQSMPRSLVVLAADAVADEAENLSPGERAEILPILREVDRARAERLLNDYPELRDKPAQKARKADYQELNDRSLLDRISRVAMTRPAMALTLAERISDPDQRKQAILQVAANAMQNGGDPDIAARALDLLSRLPGGSQQDLVPQLAALAAYAGKPGIALQYIDASFEIAAKLLEVDLDAKSACGVNPAPKDWWPSTAAYRAAVFAAVTLLHTAAEKYLARIHDADMYLLMNVEFARGLLGGGPTSTPHLTCQDATAIANDAAGS
jgi:hypothetical protein